MKKSREIIGLTVVSIQEGKELGVVKQLVIDAATGSIAALLIDDGKWYLGAKALPFSAINGLGEYAVTITSESDIIAITPTSTIGKLITQDVTVVGSAVLTHNGNISGAVSEILIDLDGQISECLIDKSDELHSVLKERVITFGKDVLIIADGNEALPVRRDSQDVTPVIPSISEPLTLEPQPEPIIEPIQIIEEPSIADIDTTIDIASVIDNVDAGLIDQTEQELEPQEQTEPVERETDDLAKMFEEKQRKYLLGKTASRRIEADNGVVVVEQGEEITEAVLQKATLSGKFVELSMSIY